MSDINLSPTEKSELLRIARKVIEEYLKNEKIPDVVSTNENLLIKRGLFVSLHKKGILRGCIGSFSSDKPIYRKVAEMAIEAAFRDPRFPPLKEKELADIDIEISILSPLKLIKDLSEIQVGTHGIYITKGLYRGVLLPQVAIEYGWDREKFLEHTCMKADLPPDSWKKGCEISIFNAIIFGEKQF